LYDPSRIDPAGWLAERLGDVTVQAPSPDRPTPRQETARGTHKEAFAEQAAAAEPIEFELPFPEPAVQPAAAPASAGRKCEWFMFWADDRSLRHCGRQIEPGLTWCPEHIKWSALITSTARSVSTTVPPLGAAA